MDLGLSGKVALVCASSKGIGKAVAKVLAEEGASVVMCARDGEALSKAREEVAESGRGEVVAVPCDLTRSVDVDALFREVDRRFGTLHILVNNAGGPPAGTFLDTNVEMWKEAFELNFLSAFRCTEKALPYMMKEGFGRIINITSFAVKQPIENLILSNGVRAGLVGMMKTLSREVGEKGITVNTICPGYILTKRLESVLEKRAAASGLSREEAFEMALSEVPAGRFGKPEEIGYVVAFLASEKAAYVNGVTLQVDGGLIRSLL
ncbi:MAG: SDR family oxidoreductase [Deltaproteobacteria bacterium]|nr:MAG: SDR family oxidoreductase [Deltaproteobacteria bacterium]